MFCRDPHLLLTQQRSKVDQLAQNLITELGKEIEACDNYLSRELVSTLNKKLAEANNTIGSLEDLQVKYLS